MATSFNPKDEDHNPPRFVDRPGRYVVQIVDGFPYSTERGQAAVVCALEVLMGESKDRRVSRLFMLEGGGTRWFADLLRAVRCEIITDLDDKTEVSRAIGFKPFAVMCRFGRVVKDPDGQPRLGPDNEPRRYMEVAEIYPINTSERKVLVENGYHAQSIDAVIRERNKDADGQPSFNGEDDIPF